MRPLTIPATMRANHEWVFENHGDDLAYAVADVEGTIPAELSGTFLRNGTGIVRLGADALNLFDAHGQVAGMSFSGGRATFRARNVRTPIFEKEMAAGRMLQRRAFTNKEARWSNLFDMSIANTAYHNAYGWGGRVVAAHDPGHFALDGSTLDTAGPVPIPLRKGQNLSPLPRHDGQNGRLIFYVHTPGLRDAIEFLEVDPTWNVVKRSGPHKLPRGAMFLHDLAITPRYYVLMHWATLSVAGALWGARPPFESVRFDPRTDGAFVIVPRDGSGPPFYLPAPGHLMFHAFNAYDDGDALVIDTVAYGDRIDFSAAYGESGRSRAGVTGLHPTPEPRVIRWHLDPARGTVRSSRVGDVVAEAPEVNHAFHGRRHRYGYAAARTVPGDEPDPGSYVWFHGVAKIDFDAGTAQSWSAGPETFVSAPAFAARPGGSGEDDGWILVWLAAAAARRTDVAVLDAHNPARGPVARVRLKHELGFVSHTEFAPDIQLAE